MFNDTVVYSALIVADGIILSEVLLLAIVSCGRLYEVIVALSLNTTPETIADFELSLLIITSVTVAPLVLVIDPLFASSVVYLPDTFISVGDEVPAGASIATATGS